MQECCLQELLTLSANVLLILFNVTFGAKPPNVAMQGVNLGAYY